MRADAATGLRPPFPFSRRRYHGAMRKPSPLFVPLLAASSLLALAACSSEDRRAGGTTASEARALEDAAEMLDDRRLPAGSVPTGAAPAAAPQASPQPGTKPPAATPGG